MIKTYATGIAHLRMTPLDQVEKTFTVITAQVSADRQTDRQTVEETDELHPNGRLSTSTACCVGTDV